MGSQTEQPVHLKSSDAVKTFSDSKSVMTRWCEYIHKLLSVSGDIEPEALEIYNRAVAILSWMKNNYG